MSYLVKVIAGMTAKEKQHDELRVGDMVRFFVSDKSGYKELPVVSVLDGSSFVLGETEELENKALD